MSNKQKEHTLRYRTSRSSDLIVWPSVKVYLPLAAATLKTHGLAHSSQLLLKTCTERLVADKQAGAEGGGNNLKTCPSVFRAFLHTFAGLALDIDPSVLSKHYSL